MPPVRTSVPTVLLEHRYVDERKLRALLSATFPPKTYSAEVRRGKWIIHTPFPLTREQIRSCSADAFDFEDKIPRKESSSLKLSSIRAVQILSEKIYIPPDPIESDPKGSYEVELFLGSLDINYRAISSYLYAANAQLQISEGQTSEVFGVSAKVSWVSRNSQETGRDYTEMVAIKRLSKETTPAKFLREYEILKTVKQEHHPNIVQVLKAFSDERDKVATYNLLFPLAIASLKAVFFQPDVVSSISRTSKTLWTQFEGLASAVAYLHKAGYAHRDIKPSNVLIYQENWPVDRLVAKIADFGLAIGAGDAPKFELGTSEARSAMKYDPPEVRKRLARAATSSEASMNPADLPTFEHLWIADVWKLGAVFTELLTYLVHGQRGIEHFRDFVTTTNDDITSDELSENLYDDGVKVKVEVLVWLTKLEVSDRRASEIVQLIKSMLDVASERPKAADIADRLVRTSLCAHFDGTRILQFTEAGYISPLSTIDIWRAKAESLLGTPVDWRPFRPVKRECLPGNIRISWPWCDEMLYLDIPRGLALYYQAKCCQPLSKVASGPNDTSNHHFSRPVQVSARGIPHWQRNKTKSSKAGSSSSMPDPKIASQPSQNTAVETTVSLREIYWCVRKAWSDRQVTCFRSLTVGAITEQGITDDKSLCKSLLEHFNQIRGLRGRWLSWKTCVDVEFIMFYRVFTAEDEIKISGVQLPKGPEYEYEPIIPDEVHMGITAKQIIAGMHNRKSAVGLATTLRMIPKKKDMALNYLMGSQGWGLHAVEGFSLSKIMAWFTACMIMGLCFVGFWLNFISKIDLQNAFTPVFFFLTVITFAVGVPQLLGAA